VETLSDQLVRSLTLPQQLLDLDRRWPDPLLAARYRDALFGLEQGGLRSRADFCVDLIADLTSSDYGPPETGLRYAAALAALCGQFLGSGGRGAVNSRRRRSRIHQTYPTAPWIGAAIATYVFGKLCQRTANTRGSYVIVDPTCETGELMLEVVIAATRANAQGSKVKLIAIDKNDLILRLARIVLNNSVCRLGISHLLATPKYVRGDALEELCKIPEVDALISNPPWGLGTDGQDRELLKSVPQNYHYADPYIAITRTALERLKKGGPFGIVLPRQALTAANARNLRIHLHQETTIDYIVELPRSVFPYATMQAVLLLGTKRRARRDAKQVRVISYSLAPERSARATLHTEHRNQAELGAPRAWLFGPSGQIAWKSISSEAVKLEQLVKIFSGLKPYRLGRGRPPQSPELIASQVYTYDWPKSGTYPVVRGRQIRRYSVLDPCEFLLVGPHLAEPGQHVRFAQAPRIFVREICLRDGGIVAAPAPPGVLGRHGVLTVVCPSPLDWVLAAVFNSPVGRDYAVSECPGFRRESFGRIAIDDLKRFPVPYSLLESTDAIELANACIKEADRAARELALRRLESLALAIYSSCADPNKTLMGLGART
jgi:N-6 DNA Methylase